MVIKALYNKKIYLVILLIYILILTGCNHHNDKSLDNNTLSDFSNTELKFDDLSFDSSDIESRMCKIQLKTLIYQSVLYQYRGINANLEDIYTKDFIESIDDTFYKTDSDIVAIESVRIEPASKNSKYTAYVKIESSSETYTQILNIANLDGNYRINEITYEE